MSVSTQGSVDQISSENIKHLVFRTEPEDVKFPPYRSKFTDTARREYKEGRQCHQTMGIAHGMRWADPDDYLKKRSRVAYKAIVDQGSRTPKTTVPVPRREDWNDPIPRVEPNFILNNVLNAIRSVPPMGPSRVFDTALGRYVHNCNMAPRFIRHENFGRVPEYIQGIKEDFRLLKELYEEEEAAAAEQEEQRIKIIPPEEREALLQKLKGVWAELQKEFQLLPFLNDTPPKIKRKENLETRLREIEKDIKTVEENPRIIVIQDPNDPECVQNQPHDPCFERGLAGNKKPSLKAVTVKATRPSRKLDLQKRREQRVEVRKNVQARLADRKPRNGAAPTKINTREDQPAQKPTTGVEKQPERPTAKADSTLTDVTRRTEN